MHLYLAYFPYGLPSPGPAALILHLDWHRRSVNLQAVHYLVHSVFHCLFEPCLNLLDGALVALDDYLVVAHEHRYDPRTLVSTLP